MFFNCNCFQSEMDLGCNNTRCTTQKVMECPLENCVENTIYHNIEHICPVHTRIINNHVVTHSYKPEYIYTTEDVYTDDNRCPNSLF